MIDCEFLDGSPCDFVGGDLDHTEVFNSQDATFGVQADVADAASSSTRTEEYLPVLTDNFRLEYYGADWQAEPGNWCDFGSALLHDKPGQSLRVETTFACEDSAGNEFPAVYEMEATLRDSRGTTLRTFNETADNTLGLHFLWEHSCGEVAECDEVHSVDYRLLWQPTYGSPIGSYQHPDFCYSTARAFGNGYETGIGGHPQGRIGCDFSHQIAGVVEPTDAISGVR